MQKGTCYEFGRNDLAIMRVYCGEFDHVNEDHPWGFTVATIADEVAEGPVFCEYDMTDDGDETGMFLLVCAADYGPILFALVGRGLDVSPEKRDPKPGNIGTSIILVHWRDGWLVCDFTGTERLP